MAMPGWWKSKQPVQHNEGILGYFVPISDFVLNKFQQESCMRLSTGFCERYEDGISNFLSYLYPSWLSVQNNSGMKIQFILLLLLLLGIEVFSQKNEVDYTWWNELHDWQEGDPGWREMMTISPGFFGPNALSVPEVKKGVLNENTELEFTLSNHFHKGDPTQDISGKFYFPFAKNKIAIEMYGVMLERFAFSEEIRNERFARIEDGRGWAIGDFYFSTLLQLARNRKFPNTLFRFGTKTASGNQLEGARFTDTPGYYFDFSFSKEFILNNEKQIRPFGLIGFYSWQTNDWLNLQNDALLYAAGFDYFTNNWSFSASVSGYSGYKKERDKPVQLNFNFRRELKAGALRLQFANGMRDWEYKTVRISYIWKFKPII